MLLLYKTRANSSPQGKRRVFFCCHPDDFDLYFDEIADEILKNCDCAIYYDSKPKDSYDLDELYMELGQMQLIVVPVTARFLLQDNRAVSIELDYSLKEHIPVLPLMQEEGLDELFNHKCGNLQYLDKQAIDATSIPYADKLRRFLQSTLLGSEAVEKVRAAFDAYIFLSYRKKDRLYAQRLMRMIHRNEFARDLAIWYDEFLVPGENFNDAISVALDKSSLFALVLTPNVVTETNYVKDIEYPLAKEKGKPIFTTEMVRTQRQLVEKVIQGEDDIVWDAENNKKFDAILNSLVSSVALRTNKNPLHDYYIGIAYLYGIDVEVNYERAMDLIHYAAENKVLEAWETLSNIYEIGLGVSIDINRSAEYLAHYCELLWEDLKGKDASDQLIQIDALMHLKGLYETLGDTSKQIETCEKILKICKKYSDYNKPDYSFDMHRTMLFSYFEIHYLKTHPGGISSDMKEYGENQIKECNLFLSRHEDVDICLLRIRWYLEIADICNFLKDYLNSSITHQDAFDWMEKSKSQIEHLSYSSLEVEKKLLVAELFNDLGHIFKSNLKKDGAERLFHKACLICDECLTYSYSLNKSSLFQKCYSDLAQCRINNNDYEGAKLLLNKTRELLKDQVKTTESPTARFALATSCANTGFLEQMMGNASDAEKLYEESISTVEKLHAEYHGHYSYSSLGFIYYQIGKYFSRTVELEKAIILYEKALDCFSVTDWTKYFFEVLNVLDKLYIISAGFVHKEDDRQKIHDGYNNFSGYFTKPKQEWQDKAEKALSLTVIPCKDMNTSCMRLALQKYLSSGGNIQNNYLINILEELMMFADEISFDNKEMREEYALSLKNFALLGYKLQK